MENRSSFIKWILEFRKSFFHGVPTQADVPPSGTLLSKPSAKMDEEIIRVVALLESPAPI